MRNYIQHYDMPPLAINFFENEEKITMDVSIDIKLLEEDKSMASKLSKEIFTGERKISVLTVLSRWDESLHRLASYLLGIKIRQSINSARRISSMRADENIAQDGNLVIIWLPNFDSKPETLSLNMLNISEKKANQILGDFEELSADENRTSK